MKQPSQALLALYERCIVGALIACEVTARELDLAAEDFSDLRARAAFSLIADLTEDAPLAFPAAFDVIAGSLDSRHPASLWDYLASAYVDFVTRGIAITYAAIVARQSKQRRARREIAERMSRRVA